MMDSVATQPLILLRARADEVGLPLSAVHRVVEVHADELNPVPRAPDEVLGVTNHWGRIVTVVALGQLLGDTWQAPDTQGPLPVLVLERGQRQLGLLVDDITEIVTSRTQKRLESRGDGLVTHMIEMEDRAVGIVSVERLVQHLKQRFSDAARA